MHSADIQKGLRITVIALGALLSVATMVMMGLDAYNFNAAATPETTLPMMASVPLFAFPVYLLNIGLTWWLTPARWEIKYGLCALSLGPFVMAFILMAIF